MNNLSSEAMAGADRNVKSGAILEGVDLRKVYELGGREVVALHEVSLKVTPGEFLAVIGPSGAGKSTLLHLLGGLDLPTSGTVFLDGRDLRLASERERSRARNERIGFVFQFFYLLAEFTAVENVMLPATMVARTRRKSARAIRLRAEELLSKLGLGSRLGHRPTELSGGESQRVAIARALINAPAVLLCDEPTGNLDSANGDEVIRLLSEMNRTERVSIIVATHDESIVERSDTVVRLRDGQMVAGGTGTASGPVIGR